jgi:hypothetical protein
MKTNSSQRNICFSNQILFRMKLLSIEKTNLSFFVCQPSSSLKRSNSFLSTIEHSHKQNNIPNFVFHNFVSFTNRKIHVSIFLIFSNLIAFSDTTRSRKWAKIYQLHFFSPFSESCFYLVQWVVFLCLYFQLFHFFQNCSCLIEWIDIWRVFLQFSVKTKLSCQTTWKISCSRVQTKLFFNIPQPTIVFFSPWFSH